MLQTLKELFKEGINSVRRFEQIKTIGQLLQVLEFRDLLSEDNVTSLEQIAKKINNRSLLNKIKEYEENHVPREFSNYYVSASEKANKTISFGGFINTTPSERDKKTERILQVVTERIGSAWRDLARNLKIQECKIDEIDDKYGSLATKASVMLKFFHERADTQHWHFVLCEALDKTRRKQLRLAVQEIMMMNI